MKITNDFCAKCLIFTSFLTGGVKMLGDFWGFVEFVAYLCSHFA